MSYSVKPRDVSPLIQKLRNFLLGREYKNALRFGEGLAPRTQPPPDLPEGPAHILFANYYCTRDARREVAHPTVIADTTPAISGGSAQAIGGGSSASEGKKPPIPGKPWQWD